MNLRVDLILESEQRSASLLNPKSLLRGTMIGVPSIIALIVLVIVMRLFALGAQVRDLEQQLEIAKPRQKDAERLRQELFENMDLLAELKGWEKSRLALDEQLILLAQAVPTNIQLARLTFEHSIQVPDGQTPARVYKGTLQGGAYTEGSEDAIGALAGKLQSGEEFKKFIDPQKKIVPIGRIKPGKDPHARTFEIEFYYRARKFE